MKRRERKRQSFTFLFLSRFSKEDLTVPPRSVRQEGNNRRIENLRLASLHNPATNVRLYSGLSKKGTMINRCCAPWIDDVDSVQFLHPLNRTLLLLSSRVSFCPWERVAGIFVKFFQCLTLNVSKTRKSKSNIVNKKRGKNNLKI